MKGFLMTLSLTAMPAAAYAGRYGPGCGSGSGTALALLFVAGVAALGYWVLRFAAKDSGSVRIAGLVVGWFLVAGGLLGFLCGIWSHSTKAAQSSSCASAVGCPMRSGAGPGMQGRKGCPHVKKMMMEKKG